MPGRLQERDIPVDKEEDKRVMNRVVRILIRDQIFL